MAKTTISIYANDEQANKVLNNVEKRMGVLEKKKHTIGLTIDEKAEQKAFNSLESYLKKLDEVNKLKEKEANGNLTNTEIKARQELEKQLTKEEKLLSSQIDKIGNIDKIYQGQLNTIKRLAEANKEIYNSILQENRAKAESIKLAKQQADAEKQLDQLRLRAQQRIRQLGDAQNQKKKGSKTGLDVAYLQKDLSEIIAEAMKLKDVIGEDSEAFQHFINGLEWSEKNNFLRALRDEGNELTKDIPKIAKELEKLKIDPDKNSNQIAGLEEEYNKKKTLLKEIIEFQEQIYNEKAKEYGLTAQEVLEGHNALQKQKEIAETLERQAITKQSNINADKIESQRQQELLDKYQKQFKLEQEIAKLRQNPAQNQKLLKLKLQELDNTKKEIQELEKAGKLTGSYANKMKEVEESSRQTVQEIDSQNKKLTSNNKTMGESLRNFARFTIYYQSLMYLKRGINEALDTMKDLDKAFTDIQLVTGDTDEKTAQLAQDYNKLAKEMGATTIEVAEGAR